MKSWFSKFSTAQLNFSPVVDVYSIILCLRNKSFLRYNYWLSSHSFQNFEIRIMVDFQSGHHFIDYFFSINSSYRLVCNSLSSILQRNARTCLREATKAPHTFNRQIFHERSRKIPLSLLASLTKATRTLRTPTTWLQARIPRFRLIRVLGARFNLWKVNQYLFASRRSSSRSEWPEI